MPNIADKTDTLIEAAEFIRKYGGSNTLVIKISGKTVDAEENLSAFAKDVATLWKMGCYPVIVHGGGRQIDEKQKELGIPVEKDSEGLRRTPPLVMKAVKEVMEGINQKICDLIRENGGRTVGIPGQTLIEAKRRTSVDSGFDLGYVGDVAKVDVRNIFTLPEVIPVVYPIGSDGDGRTLYNINADIAAFKLTRAVGAKRLVMMTDVNGILVGGRTVSEASLKDLDGWMESGEITGGMVTKVLAIKDAFREGVRSVSVIGSQGHALISELFTVEGAPKGTLIREAEREKTALFHLNFEGVHPFTDRHGRCR